MKTIIILFALFIGLVIILADLGQLGFLGALTSHNLDKVGHFLLYGILTLLIDLTLLKSQRFTLRPSLLVLRIALILSLLIGIEEFLQRYFTSRHSDLIDLTFSYLGVIFFSLAALKIKK